LAPLELAPREPERARAVPRRLLRAHLQLLPVGGATASALLAAGDVDARHGCRAAGVDVPLGHPRARRGHARGWYRQTKGSTSCVDRTGARRDRGADRGIVLRL